MKKYFFIIIISLSTLVTFAQDDPYLLRMHYVELEGDIQSWINYELEYNKKLAKLAVDDGKWDGWQMWQSQSNYNQFIFFHHFKNPTQFEKFPGWEILNDENAKRIGLKKPETPNVNSKGNKPMELFQITSTALSGTQSEYFVINEYSTSSPLIFVNNNELWGEMMVTPKLEQNPGMNFAAGIKLLSDNTDEINYNGISFDGFSSLTSLIESQAYFEGKWDNPNGELQAFIKAANEAKLSNFAENKRSSFWKVIGSTWD